MRKISVAEFLNPTEPGGKGQGMGEILDLGFLKGKHILDIGILNYEQCGNEDGSLAIDYDNNGKIYRAVFCYNDLGFWMVWNGEKGKDNDNDEDLLRDKVWEIWRYIVDSHRGGGLEIVSDPLKGKYVFADKGNEIITLEIKDLKVMGTSVSRHFSGQMNLEAIIESIRLWLCSFPGDYFE